MSNAARIFGQASSTLETPLNVEEVFSTYLFKPNTAGDYPVNNGIDLSTEGGLVFMKNRIASSPQIPLWHDTERWGGSYGGYLRSDADNGAAATTYFTSFNTDGFTPKDMLNEEMTSWTFRKAPRFFDVVTYTGTGPGTSANEQQVAHNLGVKPGVVIVKRLDTTGDWWFLTDVIDGTYDDAYLNQTSGFGNNGNSVPTDSIFNVGGGINISGASYVAYIFANNDGDGGFGPNGDQDIIKCGSYTGNGSTSGPSVDLGFEPQWLLVKNANDSGSNWQIFDTMRGMPVSGSNFRLYPNTSDAEASLNNAFALNATGFQVTSGHRWVNGTSQNHIYIAIRRGPMAVPTDATDVFAMDTGSTTAPAYTAGFPVDMAFKKYTSDTDNWRISSRLIQGINHYTNLTNSDDTDAYFAFDYQNGYYSESQSTPNQAWMWKRAPNYFDVVAYTGTGSTRTVSHNLGVAPEMIWVKDRGNATNWSVYHSGLNVNSDNAPETDVIFLNSTSAAGDDIDYWNDTAPTSSVFTLGNQANVNGSSRNYIAYLFASLDGVSKVGSFTGNGSSQDIDCGFSSGARFVLLKRTDSSGTWFILDTERGIVAGNDAILRPNSTVAEDNNYDIIDPLSSGFTINYVSAYNMNASGATYIFYAIA